MRTSFSGGGARIPRLAGIDQTRQLLADPYRFIARRCDELGSDVVEGRLLMQRTLLMRGAAAAELFYDQDRFARHGAAPEPVQATLFGKGGVQGLDGPAHLHRKALFMGQTGPHPTQELQRVAEAVWQALAPRWERRERLQLYHASQDWLARSACAWAGVPVPDAEMPQRRAQLVALFDCAASGVAAHLHARRARHEAEAWLAGLIEQARRGDGVFPADSPAQAVALHADLAGRQLPARVAAVELLNLIRPITAVSVFIVQGAHALATHPDWRAPLGAGDPVRTLAFVQEVRRHYPFFPALVARTKRSFLWNGFAFPQGVRVMLDVYGTNHDPRSWEDAGSFRPERFIGAPPGAFSFIPQGGAQAQDHHRCPGEDFAIALMRTALRQLARARYEVPPQDLSIDMARLPAVPRDRMELANLHWG